VDEEAKEKEQGIISGRVIKRLRSNLSRLVTEVVVRGREAGGSQRERAIQAEEKATVEEKQEQVEDSKGDHWASH
jgi:hypothetical protein